MEGTLGLKRGILTGSGVEDTRPDACTLQVALYISWVRPPTMLYTRSQSYHTIYHLFALVFKFILGRVYLGFANSKLCLDVFRYRVLRGCTVQRMCLPSEMAQVHPAGGNLRYPMVSIRFPQMVKQNQTPSDRQRLMSSSLHRHQSSGVTDGPLGQLGCRNPSSSEYLPGICLLFLRDSLRLGARASLLVTKGITTSN